jgi:hypothetical protein
MKKKNLKALLRHLKANPVYVDGFGDRESVFSNFAKPDEKDIVLCYAAYWCECYEGSATVIYYRKSTRKYYEAYGSHCSCYGLEDQWNGDEELNFVEFENRLEKGYLYDGNTMKNLYDEFRKG